MAVAVIVAVVVAIVAGFGDEPVLAERQPGDEAHQRMA